MDAPGWLTGPEGGPAPRTAQRRRARPRREAYLRLRRIDPWAWLKVSLIVAVVMWMVWMLIVGLLYLSFDALGVLAKVNATYESLASSGTGAASGNGPLITGRGVFVIAAIFGGVIVVLFTIVSTVVAMLYNAAAGVTGGVEITLAERDTG